MLDQLIYEYGLFLEQLRKHIRVSETNINKITIHIGVIDDYSSGQCQCRALVNNVNGKEYRCTRKKKFGDFCGLHFNRKNSFKSIKSSSISSVETFSLNLLEMISDIENNNYFKLADKILDSCIDLIKKNGVYEYYNSSNNDSKGCGDNRFSWSAAIFICMIENIDMYSLE